MAQTKADGLKRTRERIQQKAEFEYQLAESRTNYAVNRRKQIDFLKKKLDEFSDMIIKFNDASRKKAK